MRARLVLAAVLSAAAPPLRAQAGPSVLEAGAAFNDCQREGFSAAPVGITACPEHGVDGSAAAQATFTALHARAAVGGAAQGGVVFSPQAAASAYAHDTFTFTGALPAAVQLDFALDGTESGSVGNARTEAYAKLAFDAAWASGRVTADAGYVYLLDALGARADTSAGPEGAWVGSGGQGHARFAVTTAVNTLTLDLTATVDLYDFVDGTRASGTAAADYYATGRITGLQFFDAAGADVTATTPFTVASGAAYPLGAPGSTTTAPEPGPLALALGGLAAAGAAAWGRRRAA
ncbi:hypothetical protein tb265_46450 [Gemmatimonadetes bacterium T265]|nr:hypothetical protein tb265_46450 [Gemmatimonadetes bacterium T265]